MLYITIAVLAFLLAMAPIYYTFLSRYIFQPFWMALAYWNDFSYRLNKARICFSQQVLPEITDEDVRPITATGAYTFGYITKIRWVGEIKEFYVSTEKDIPAGVDAVVVLSTKRGFIGKIDSCDKGGCWAVSVWDNRTNIPVFLEPSGYIGWLRWSDSRLIFFSISAPLDTVGPGERIYWLGNPHVYIGQTTSTLTNNVALVKLTVPAMEYEPVFIYTEVLSR